MLAHPRARGDLTAANVPTSFSAASPPCFDGRVNPRVRSALLWWCAIAAAVPCATARAQQRASGVSLGQLLAPPPVAPSAPEPEPEQIARRLDALARHPAAASAQAALEEGRQALARARAARAGKRIKEAERATQVAWAALSLATARIAAAGQRLATDAALRRAQAAELELTRARERLRKTQAQRAEQP